MASNRDSRETVWISGTFTADGLVEPLSRWLERITVPMAVRLAPYNQVLQQLLDAGSALRANRAGVNVVLVRGQDLVPQITGGASPGFLERNWPKLRQGGAELVEAVHVSAAQTGVPHMVVFCPSVLLEPVSQQRAELEDDLKRQLESEPAIEAVTTTDIFRSYPVEVWHDAEGERVGHVPFRQEFFVAVATMIARRTMCARSRPRKVIVLDCDNTLWSGVCGEVGAAGIELGAPYRALQEFMVRQAAQGMLLCLCSKNVESDVLDVFARRADMPLRLSHLAGWRINWQSKANNIAALASDLSLGLNSFIFLDDDPVQCAEVEARLPEVLTLRLPEDPARIPTFLAHCWAFDRSLVTAEDQTRTESYRNEMERKLLLRGARSFADFLDGLGLRIDVGPAGRADAARIAQLSQRTNQFNTTTLRRSESEVIRFCEVDENLCVAVRVRDRFGDYGLVGAAFAEPQAGGLHVSSVLLSCRALGRGVEHRIVAALGSDAMDRGLPEVTIAFRPSARNRPARDFLEAACPEDAREEETGETRFRLAAQRASRLRFEPRDEAPERPTTAVTVPASSAKQAPETSILRWIAEEMTDVATIALALQRIRTRPPLAKPFSPARSATERAVADIFRLVLELDRVGVHDDFAELGGKSFHLVRIHGLLLDRLGVDLDITTLFQHPTVASLANSFRDGGRAGRMSHVRRRATRQREALARLRERARSLNA